MNTYKILKRTIDIVGASAGLLLFSPFIVTAYVAIVIVMGLPVIFSQNRAGLKGKSFRLYKFRSMSDDIDPRGQLLPDDQRLGRFGKFLRTYSIDELPSLICVLKGDMSLVGPRPLLLDYLPLYTARQFGRHEVKPGITGWAQINGRNALSWQEKFEHDLWYVSHQSIWLDLKILCLTIATVFSRQGIVSEGEVTGSRFLGNSSE